MRITLRAITLICILAVHSRAVELGEQFDAFDFNRRLGQAVNLGNALEAPREGAWGMVLQDWYFESIAAGGFDSVRVPIKWSGHADDTAPYQITDSLFERVDWVIEQAQKNGLAVILNVHHYDEIHQDIDGHRDRLAGLWSQIATRYRDQPRSSVYFEIMNEPHSDFTDTRWRSVFEQSLATIRQTNPDRMVIVGGINWNSVNGLQRLRLPEEDRNLIGTFHYYDPFRFTHQGAEWVSGSEPWLGTTWQGTETEQLAVEAAFRRIARWSERYDRPVFLGEFGAYSTADMESRANWTEFVARTAEQHDFSWGYWEFGAGFGVMDRSTRAWVEPLYAALSPKALLNLDEALGYQLGDIDLLSAAIRQASQEPRFDLDGDGLVNAEDLDYWVYFSGHEWGDADLNGRVDFDDFLVLGENFGQPVEAWSEGDFNADGFVGFDDFLRLSQNIAVDRNVASVPESGGGFWTLLICLTMMRLGQVNDRRWTALQMR